MLSLCFVCFLTQPYFPQLPRCAEIPPSFLLQGFLNIWLSSYQHFNSATRPPNFSFLTDKVSLIIVLNGIPLTINRIKPADLITWPPQVTDANQGLTRYLGSRDTRRTKCSVLSSFRDDFLYPVSCFLLQAGGRKGPGCDLLGTSKLSLLPYISRPLRLEVHPTWKYIPGLGEILLCTPSKDPGA